MPDGGDPVKHDQHMTLSQHRPPALLDSIADKLAGDADQPTGAMAAGPVEMAKSSLSNVIVWPV